MQRTPAVTGILLVLLGYMVFERQRWLREARTQCAAAEPLVGRRAARADVILALGPAREYQAADLAELLEEFARTSPKGEDLASDLSTGSTLLLYSGSNSLMFLYLDDQHRASLAHCFLQ